MVSHFTCLPQVKDHILQAIHLPDHGTLHLPASGKRHILQAIYLPDHVTLHLPAATGKWPLILCRLSTCLPSHVKGSLGLLVMSEEVLCFKKKSIYMSIYLSIFLYVYLYFGLGLGLRVCRCCAVFVVVVFFFKSDFDLQKEEVSL